MSIFDPYAATSSTVERVTIFVPEKILTKIEHGWIAAVICALLTLAFIGVAVAADPGAMPLQLADTAVMLGLAVGIHRRSRVCAILALLVFGVGKQALLGEGVGAPSLFVFVIFIYLFVQAILGTFAYHRFMKQATRQ